MRRPSRIVALALLASSAPALAQLGDGAPDFVVLADAEGDGYVSQDEFTAYYALIWEILAPGEFAIDPDDANPLLRAAVVGVLPNAKGLVGRDQFLDAATRKYRDADKDQNGVVSMAEMRAWKAAAMTPPHA
jgi:hypothetical protein